jgi:Protein of unknown function (DUF3347)
MKNLPLLPLLTLIIILNSCSGDKEKKTADSSVNSSGSAVTVQTDSSTKTAISAMLGAYYQLKDALVEADTSAASLASMKLATLADSIHVDGLNDSSLINTINNLSGTIAAEAKTMPQEADITEKRRSFSMITENFYPLLQAVQYNDAIVYHQMCPMAFNDTESAFWLSDNREIMNPYLGKKHPKYSAGMLHCGELKDSISYRK